MDRRDLFLLVGAVALAAVDVALVAQPHDQGGWEWRRAWPMAFAVTQIALATAAVVWWTEPLVVRGILLAGALGYGWLVAERVLIRDGGMWLVLWLAMAGTTFALASILRLAGLRLVDHTKLLDDSASADASKTSTDTSYRSRQFSLAAIFSATLLVAIFAAVVRYTVPPDSALLFSSALIACGWGVLCVVCLLLVMVEGPLWLRAILMAMLVLFVYVVTQLLDQSAGRATESTAFLQVCTATLPVLGGLALALRCAGFSLDWI